MRCYFPVSYRQISVDRGYFSQGVTFGMKIVTRPNRFRSENFEASPIRTDSDPIPIGIGNPTKIGIPIPIRNSHSDSDSEF